MRQGITPTPRPAQQHGVTFSHWHRWADIEVAPNIAVGGPQLPFIAEAGKPFRVRYARNPADIGQSGTPARITLKWRMEDGPVHTAMIADGTRDMRSGELLRRDVILDIPTDARGTLATWFEVETTDGALLFDSDYGRNYRAQIVPVGGAALRFDDWWGEQLHGELVAGGALRLPYDTDRLRQFLYGTTHRGFETWNVTAFVQFMTANGAQTPIELPLTVAERGPQGSTIGTATYEPAIPIPDDATEVSVWFRGSSYGGSVFGGNAWDSNEGLNYTRPISPRR